MEEQRWRKKIVKSAMGDEGGRKVPLLSGETSSPRAHSRGQASLKGLPLLLCKTVIWKCQVMDLRAKPNIIPFHSEVAYLL